MKNLSISSIALLIVFSISVLGVNNNEDNNDENKICHPFNTECSIDRDCCTQNCRRTFYYFRRYCKEPINMMNAYKFFVSPRVHTWTCVYKEQNDSISARLNRTFGYNAAHHNLLPGTLVEVTYGGIQETLTINNHRSKLLGETLELSTETAKKLGFKDYGIGPCQVNFPGLSNYKNFVKKVLYFFFPLNNLSQMISWFVSKLENN